MADTDPTDGDLNTAARAALLTALRTGKSVTFNGRQYTSHDLEDLLGLIASTGGVAGEGGAPRTRVASYCSGL